MDPQPTSEDGEYSQYSVATEPPMMYRMRPQRAFAIAKIPCRRWWPTSVGMRRDRADWLDHGKPFSPYRCHRTPTNTKGLIPLWIVNSISGCRTIVKTDFVKCLRLYVENDFYEFIRNKNLLICEMWLVFRFSYRLSFDKSWDKELDDLNCISGI